MLLVGMSHNRHLTGMHLMCVSCVQSMGVYLTGVYLMGVYLTGVYLMGVHFSLQCVQQQQDDARRTYVWPTRLFRCCR